MSRRFWTGRRTDLACELITSHLRQFTVNGESNKTIQSLHELIRNACEFADATASTRVEVTLQLNATADRIIADRIQIEQVLISLMRNVLKAMQASERRELFISTSLIDGGMIQTDIADTGSGLTLELRSDLFEPFITTKTYDMGIGMSISEAIVEAHHGKLGVAFDSGGGTGVQFHAAIVGHGN